MSYQSLIAVINRRELTHHMKKHNKMIKMKPTYQTDLTDLSHENLVAASTNNNYELVNMCCSGSKKCTILNLMHRTYELPLLRIRDREITKIAISILIEIIKITKTEVAMLLRLLKESLLKAC